MQKLSTFFSSKGSAETSQLLKSASLKLNLNEKLLKRQLVCHCIKKSKGNYVILSRPKKNNQIKSQKPLDLQQKMHLFIILPGWRVGRGGKKWREKKSDEVREGCKKMGKVWSFTIPPRYGLFFRKKLTPIFVVENCIFNGQTEFYAGPISKTIKFPFLTLAFFSPGFGTFGLFSKLP